MNAIAPILHFGRTRRSWPALIEGDRIVSYGQLAELIRRTASHLEDLGLCHRDQVGLCLKDNIDHVIALLAVVHAGGVAVPLDWRARAKENADFIDALPLTTVLAEEDARLPDNCRKIRLNSEWHRAVACADANRGQSSGWDDPFVISATSGSTGAPKFTLMTHLQYHFAMCGMFELMALAGCHRFLCTLPLYYSGGRNSCIAHLLRGDCVVLYPSLFTPDEYSGLVTKHGITVGVIVPSVVRQLLAGVKTEPMLPQLSKLFCTGAPLYPEEKRAAVQKLSANFYERYGTAETLAISVLKPDDFIERVESVGQPHSLAEIEIVDDNGSPVPTGEVGRLRFRGPGLGTPLIAAAEEKSFRDGWFYPGEIGRLDEAGYIFLHGRTSDVIIRSGAKIYPAEVEKILLEFAGVAEAAVLGELGRDNEEFVVAFVVPNGGVTTAELLTHCRARLTPHKVPQSIRLIDHLPRNTAGKVDKRALVRCLDDRAAAPKQGVILADEKREAAK
jgi:acyl-coenzyme A synthetase/AMP-(fatty) acid ligase